ncbi:MAG: hypothetical protein LBC61_02755 [Candidatus Peribacteria bacterium]|nr:hypothetical protein [Candidatus Peribacteria bacterium]
MSNFKLEFFASFANSVSLKFFSSTFSLFHSSCFVNFSLATGSESDLAKSKTILLDSSLSFAS